VGDGPFQFPEIHQRSIEFIRHADERLRYCEELLDEFTAGQERLRQWMAKRAEGMPARVRRPPPSGREKGGGHPATPVPAGYTGDTNLSGLGGRRTDHTGRTSQFTGRRTGLLGLPDG
jgi:hypothetical protein